jgi:cytochrome c oxidase subunit IV
MEQAELHNHVMSYQTLVTVWVALLALTATLVVAGTLYHATLSVPAMLVLTPLKAGLVFYYFMHLKYEKPFLKLLVMMTLASLILFLGFIFLDIAYR